MTNDEECKILTQQQLHGEHINDYENHVEGDGHYQVMVYGGIVASYSSAG